MLVLRRWCGLALFSIACGASDGDDDPTDAGSTSDTTASTTAPTSTTDPSTTASSTETMSTTDATTASSSTASTTTADTEDDATTNDASSTGDTDSATPCGDGICGADEVCVLPCCGGPAPGCEDSDENGECANGQEPTPADQCGSGCNTELCCPMLPCMAEPPFCAGAADLQCHETQCSLDACFGSLQDGQLTCECA